MFDIIEHTLSAAVVDNGTFAVSYPSGRTAGSYTSAFRHKMAALQTVYNAPVDFTLAFGASNITVTWKANTTLPAGTAVVLQVDRLGLANDDIFDADLGAKMHDGRVLRIDIGSPLTADADGVSASQSITAGTPALINGALASGGVATFDVPRNVVAAWTGTAVMTVTGTDEYGNVVVESSASGITMAGKKAFKTVTAVNVSANVTLATVGSGDVFGLPVYLPNIAFVLNEIQDAAVATAGTIVAGVSSVATATTGDVRGTYDPNAAADGSKNFSLIAFIPDAAERGVSQYAG